MTPVTLPVLGLAVLVDGSYTPGTPGGYYRNGDPCAPEPEDFEVRRIIVDARFAPGEQAPELEWDGLTERDQGAIEDALRCADDGANDEDAWDARMAWTREDYYR